MCVCVCVCEHNHSLWGEVGDQVPVVGDVVLCGDGAVEVLRIGKVAHTRETTAVHCEREFGRVCEDSAPTKRFAATAHP